MGDRGLTARQIPTEPGAYGSVLISSHTRVFGGRQLGCRQLPRLGGNAGVTGDVGLTPGACKTP